MNGDSYVLFIALTVGSAAALAAGNILERVGLRHTGNRVSLSSPLVFIASLLRNAPWWGGILLSGSGTLGYYAAMGFYNISLVQPMMVLNPMLTALLGWWLLRERMTLRIAIAIACVSVGLLLAGFQANEVSGMLDEAALWLFAAIALAALLLVRYCVTDLEVRDAATMGFGFGLSAVFYKSIALELSGASESVWFLLLNLRVPVFAALYLLGFIYSQIALSRGRALFAIPFSAALGTFLPIAAGLLVFGEPASPLKIASTLCVLLGSVLFVGRMTHGKHKN